MLTRSEGCSNHIRMYEQMPTKTGHKYTLRQIFDVAVDSNGWHASVLIRFFGSFFMVLKLD